MSRPRVWVTWDDAGTETWHRCVWCGQQLTTEVTQARGYGRECASLVEWRPGLFEARQRSARKAARRARVFERAGAGERRPGESEESLRRREEVWEQARARLQELRQGGAATGA